MDEIEVLAQTLLSFRGKPYKFVMYAFPWGEGDLVAPEEWQKKILLDVEHGLITPNKAIQIAVASGHGIGKSSLVAWLILWSLSTCVDTKGITTANTETQLKTKTWAELAKWHNLFIGKDAFEFTATAIYSKAPGHEKTWRIDQIAWSENNSEAFAGLHNKGKRIILIMDEASAIADKIWEVTRGALTDEDTEIMWFVFGNPTRSNGEFHACFNGMRHRWKQYQIDSRTVTLTNKKQIQEWVDDYGEDSDFVRVRVRGVFPRMSEHQFISSEIVEEARNRKILSGSQQYAPKILCLDNAWTGGDEICIGMRQGNLYQLKATWQRNDDDFVIAGNLARIEDEVSADGTLIDLGYGTGVFSAGKQLNRNWILIPFGGASPDHGFCDMMGHMWNQMKKWLKEGGSIPNDPVLITELTNREAYVVATGPNAGKIRLESKKDMKARGLASPNRSDPLAMSFARPILPRIQREMQEAATQRAIKNWDPYSNLATTQETTQKNYDPYRNL